MGPYSINLMNPWLLFYNFFIVKSFVLKNFGNVVLDKRGLGNKYGLLIVQPVFLEASSFHSDTSGHYSLTFIFEGT